MLEKIAQYATLEQKNAIIKTLNSEKLRTAPLLNEKLYITLLKVFETKKEE